jgi:acyl carrier protein
MPPESEISARIRAALAAHVKRDVRTIEPRHALRDDLGIDSMATIELLFNIEEAFDLQIPDEDLRTLRTVGDVIAYVEAKTAPSKRPAPKKKA